MEIELFYVRYAADSGYVLRSDDVGEFLAGLHRHLPAHWTTEEHAHADRAERLFRAWSCVRHDEHREWVAFAAIVDGKQIVIGVEAVCDLLRGPSDMDKPNKDMLDFLPFAYEATAEEQRRWMGGDPQNTMLVTVKPDGIYLRGGRGDKVAGPASAASIAAAAGRLDMLRWVR